MGQFLAGVNGIFAFIIVNVDGVFLLRRHSHIALWDLGRKLHVQHSALVPGVDHVTLEPNEPAEKDQRGNQCCHQ